MMIDVDERPAHAATGGVTLSGADPVVVLVHGAGMDATVWQLQTRHLAHHGFRPMAVDLPGHGRSAGEPLTTIAEMAAWLGRFIDATGEQSVNLVGHSMGSFIVMELAARRSQSMRSLVLLGTGDAMAVHPELLAAAADDLPRAAALMAAWGHAKPAHVGLNPTPGLWMLGGARALVEIGPRGSLATDFDACAGYDNATVAAAAVRCPVTVGVGLGDKMTPPRAAARLIEQLHEPRVVELAGTGHMMMVENPAAVRRLLVEAFSVESTGSIE